MNSLPFWIGHDAPPEAFPDASHALEEPNGLLAVGGDLSPARLLYAYRRGIFPWFNEDQPILWWSPDPRAVLFPETLRISRSLGKSLRNKGYGIRIDEAFQEVIRSCAAPRAQQPETWITPDMMDAYMRLHELGHAHSVEIWRDGTLCGGLYGVAMGRVFFGESMFSLERDASKVALVHLCRVGFELIDCQIVSDHLLRLGAVELPRAEFTRLLRHLCEADPVPLTGAAAEASS